jgi:predicted CXXCH cytochrome family protein
MKLIHWITAIVIATVVCAVASYAKAKPTTRPISAIAPSNCTTTGCHSEVKQYKVVHGPVNVNACDACHKPKDVAAHTFDLTRGKTEMCTFCHQLDMKKTPVIHKPVAQGECLQCHNPHGGTSAKFLRGRTMRELCAKCHQDPVGDKTAVHGPVAAGACDSCHSAHSSKEPKLLAVSGRDLCLSCHTEMKKQMLTVKFQHKAVEQDCMNCHDPHASNFAKQTKKAPVELCTSCHDKIKDVAMNAPHKHSPVTKDQACLTCHTAHGGDLAKLMRADPLKVCMKCHDKKIDEGSGGRVVNAVAEVMDPKQFPHGPIKDGNCAGCHNPHGAQETRLLKKPYPETFYQGFALDKYDLCFTCHDKQLVQLETTEGLTGFRNGNRNLHFLHVNKTDKGRSCRACHETHASKQQDHIRDSVPYGKWEMPINFKKTDSGGSCAPGCHKPYSYDRQNPVLTVPAATAVSEAKEKQ